MADQYETLVQMTLNQSKQGERTMLATHKSKPDIKLCTLLSSCYNQQRGFLAAPTSSL